MTAKIEKTESPAMPYRRLAFPVLLAALLLWPNWLAVAQNPPTGTGHKATLTWKAPAAPGGTGTVAGYNIYRSSSGANFIKINSAPIAGLTTVDTAVTANTQYAYCGSTVDSGGGESPCSIQVSTTVPADRNPPTGLAAVSE